VSEGVSGLVEAVGLRSTRVQTPDGSLLVVPNGKLADTAIENLGGRRHINFSTTFTLTPDSARQHFVAFSEAILKKLEASTTFKVLDPEMNIAGISMEGIEVELAANLQPLNGGSKRDAINLLFLDVLQVAASEGIEFVSYSESTSP
ncbi:mechanosensitive ion channel domain-containing protein, partial [Aestuariivirga sp.]|uniref:mechanosensitive ion channel domain-containing protein n=1 Tax=Aestuariivirga sp. TaxID=2650926 RepID=UPI0030192B44